MSPSTDRDKLQAADKPTLYKQIRVCAENIIRVDDVTEAGGMIGLLCFALAVLTSPFKPCLHTAATITSSTPSPAAATFFRRVTH
jgi:hypothetical protein